MSSTPTPSNSPPSTSRPLFDRTAKELCEDRDLAPWAAKSATTLGRRHPEEEDDLRTGWERDRDRIVHSTAFRRLAYKTQVFVNRRGDHHRTRLSHSLEVCQVARSVGTALALNEALCESIALVHDIGHPPFGHRGERALNDLMSDHQGFRHNRQVLRVIDLLERRSPDYPGLNLTRELRESVLKHESESDWPMEFRPRPRRPLLEAQVVDLADSTAYNMHDVEDGLNAGMFSEDELGEAVALWRSSMASVEDRHPGFLKATGDRKLRVKRIANELIKVCINDLILASNRRVVESGVKTAADVRAHDRTLIGYSAPIKTEVGELQAFLEERFYRHEQLQRFSSYAQRILSRLFPLYMEQPREMPDWYQTWANQVGPARATCDYLAGMTDRFAEHEFERLTGTPLPEI